MDRIEELNYIYIGILSEHNKAIEHIKTLEQKIKEVQQEYSNLTQPMEQKENNKLEKGNDKEQNIELNKDKIQKTK